MGYAVQIPRQALLLNGHLDVVSIVEVVPVRTAPPFPSMIMGRGSGHLCLALGVLNSARCVGRTP